MLVNYSKAQLIVLSLFPCFLNIRFDIKEATKVSLQKKFGVDVFEKKMYLQAGEAWWVTDYKI